jgi:hypothetical protein
MTVTPSEAKECSGFLTAREEKQILRFAQDDMSF